MRPTSPTRFTALIATAFISLLLVGCSDGQSASLPQGEDNGERTCPAVAYYSSAVIRLQLTSPFDQIGSATLDMCLNRDCGKVVLNLTEAPLSGCGLGVERVLVPADAPWFSISAILWATLAGGQELEADWSTLNLENLHDGDVYTFKGTARDGTVLFDLVQKVDHYTGNTDPSNPCPTQWKTFSITLGQ
jgi:hypothetical protein